MRYYIKHVSCSVVVLHVTVVVINVSVVVLHVSVVVICKGPCGLSEQTLCFSFPKWPLVVNSHHQLSGGVFA